MFFNNFINQFISKLFWTGPRAGPIPMLDITKGMALLVTMRIALLVAMLKPNELAILLAILSLSALLDIRSSQLLLST
jgi:hypothetical protein